MCFTHGSWARWAATSRFPFMITNVCMRSCNLRIFWATEVFFHSVDCRGEVYHRQICHIYSGISKHNFLFSLHLDHHLVSQIVSQFPGSFSSSLHCFWSVWVHTVSVLFLVVVYCFNYCVHLRSFFGSLRVILHLFLFVYHLSFCVSCFCGLKSFLPHCVTFCPFCISFGSFCLLMILSVLCLCSFASFVFFVILVYFSSFRVSILGPYVQSCYVFYAICSLCMRCGHFWVFCLSFFLLIARLFLYKYSINIQMETQIIFYERQMTSTRHEQILKKFKDWK